ncbi:MAG: type II toxin-antitoxin system HicA family toxin [bacterium]|nr:type II toxin-antitoxin system HicA family toxin [bacterium]
MRVLKRLGFYSSRSRGSHVIMVHKDGRRTMVPMHGRDIPSGTLSAILKDMGISKEEFAKLL